MNLDDWRRLKARIDALRQRADRAEGARAELLRRLEAEHGCRTVREAEKLRDRLEREADAAEREADAGMARWRKKWGDLIGEGEE